MNNLKEVSVDGIVTQKRQLSKYIFEELGYPKSEKIRTKYNTFITTGFTIEGYKIKYNIGGLILDHSENKIDYHTKNAIASTKLLELYEKLKQKFDIKPNISTIVDSTNATRISLFRFKEDECEIYKAIKFLEITKDKDSIYNIDDVKTIDLPTIDLKNNRQQQIHKGDSKMEKIIKLIEDNYQDFRREVLNNLGVVLKIVFGDKFILWNFDTSKFENHKSNILSKEEYVENMIEKEMIEVYQHLVLGGIRTTDGNEEGIKVLTDKYEVCKIESEITTNTQTNNEVKDMLKLTKKDLMNQIKIMRNDLIDGNIEKCADNLGTYKKINESEVNFYGMVEPVFDYMAELKNCTLIKTPAFKKEVAKWVQGDFKIVGDIKVVVNGIFGTAEVLVDVEDLSNGQIVKDMCYLWDNNCNYSKHEELRKKYPNAEENFYKRKHDELVRDMLLISDGTMATLLEEIGIGEHRKDCKFIHKVVGKMIELLKNKKLSRECDNWMQVWENVKEDIDYNRIEVELGLNEGLASDMLRLLGNSTKENILDSILTVFSKGDIEFRMNEWLYEEYNDENTTLGKTMAEKIKQAIDLELEKHLRNEEVNIKILDMQKCMINDCMELDDEYENKIDILRYDLEGAGAFSVDDFKVVTFYDTVSTDEEKIDLFEKYNIKVDIIGNELIMFNVTEQLAGQLCLFEIEEKIETEEVAIVPVERIKENGNIPYEQNIILCEETIENEKQKIVNSINEVLEAYTEKGADAQSCLDRLQFIRAKCPVYINLEIIIKVVEQQIKQSEKTDRQKKEVYTNNGGSYE